MMKLTIKYLILIGLTVFESNAIADERGDGFILITPDKCVLEENQTYCKQWYQIEVSLAEPGNFCLFLDDETTAIYCFEKTQIQIERQLELRQDTFIRLKDMNTDLYLANAKIQLMTFMPVKQRKRRNLSWGIF